MKFRKLKEGFRWLWSTERVWLEQTDFCRSMNLLISVRFLFLQWEIEIMGTRAGNELPGSSFRDAGWGAQSGERAGEMMSPGWLLNASVLQELEEIAGNTRYMFKFLNSSSLHLIEFNPTFLIATSSPRVFSIVRIFLLLYYSTAENLYHRWAMALNTEKQNRIKVMSSSFVFRPISKIQTYSAQSAVMS